MNRRSPTVSAAPKHSLVRWDIHLLSKPLRWMGISLSIWLLPMVGTMRPAIGADRIYFTYGALERSIPIDSLQTYIKTGKLDADLAPYAKRFSQRQRAELRRLLANRIDLSPVAISQFFYSPIGKTLLTRLGELIQSRSGLSGFYGLRGALILAAADPQGLTLLNVLQKFPTSGVRVDLGRLLQTTGALEKLVTQTNQAVALVSQQSKTAATTAQPKADFSRLPDLQQTGRFPWSKQTLMLNDPRRASKFLADIYLPQLDAKAPVIVISYGLGEDRSSFAYLAEQLASYGFVVAVPENPGSSAQQVRSLLSGLANEVAEPREFINRALNVKFLLDELQRRSQSDPTFQVNMQQVGVIGQSFGGYTALALAGAPINFSQLQKGCENLHNSLNLSLILQCRALELPRFPYDLHDQRIIAVIAINPIDSSIFGPASLSQIRVPVMLISGSADTVAPALAEQIVPFSWLTTPEKYLVVIQGGTHFSTIDETNASRYPLAIPSTIAGSNTEIARRYVEVLSVAFCQTYIAGAKQYLPYLSASYAQTISQAPLNLSLVQSLTATQLASALNGNNKKKVSPSPGK